MPGFLLTSRSKFLANNGKNPQKAAGSHIPRHWRRWGSWGPQQQAQEDLDWGGVLDGIEHRLALHFHGAFRCHFEQLNLLLLALKQFGQKTVILLGAVARLSHGAVNGIALGWY